MTIKKKLKLTLFFMLSLSLFLGFASTRAFGENGEKKAYLIVANKLLLSDIEHMENLKGIISESGIGLMNVRGASSYNDIESFLTINSSAKANGIQNMAKMSNLEGENKYLYEIRMGQLDEDYKVGNIEFNRIKLFNMERKYKPELGAFGENLKRSGIKRAVYGNSDGEEALRLGSLIAMDSSGLVEYGDVENINLEDNTAPHGKRMDYEKVLENIEELKDEVSFTVVDIGDLDRLSSYGLYLDDNMFDYHRLRALGYLDEFILNLKKSVGKDSMIMLLSPNEGEMRIEESKLSPVVVWTDDMEPSVLTSGSTRIKGLVTNMDIAPAISDYLGAGTEGYVGRNIEYVGLDNRIGYLTDMSNQSNFLLRARTSALYYYAVFAMAMSVLLGLFILASRKISDSSKNRIQNILALIVSLPIAFMLVPILKIENAAVLIAVSLAVATALVVATRNMGGEKRLLMLYSLISALLVADTVMGSSLARNSVMGYSPIIGARYFGIGNELAGLFLASIAIASGILIQRYRKKAVGIVPFVGLLIMIAPKIGANVGGSISFAAMAMTMVALNSKRKINAKLIVGMGLSIAASVILVGLLDARLSSSPTHLGKLVLEVQNEGLMNLLDVATRKLSMNIKLMGSSIWSQVLLVTAVMSAALIAGSENSYRRAFRENPYKAKSLIALVVGSVIGLLANDSGVLLAAFASIYMLVFIMQIGLDQKKKES